MPNGNCRVGGHAARMAAVPRTNPDLIARRAAAQRAVGLRLAAARRAAGLSQAEAARRLGVAQSQIAKAELGLRSISLVEGLDLADLYGVAPSEFDPRPQIDFAGETA